MEKTAERKLMRQDGRAGVIKWYCSSCDWVEMTIYGAPGEITEDLAQEMFNQHICEQKYPITANSR
jgi:hypothetical protein